MGKLLSNREFDAKSVDEKIAYYRSLKEYCLENFKPTKPIRPVRSFVLNVYPHIVRHYDYVTSGEKNIPEDGRCLFSINHSNTHDVFTALENFEGKLGLKTTTYGAKDDVGLATKIIFRGGSNMVLFDRGDRQDAENALFQFCSNVIAGYAGELFGESTWNLHPFKLMQPVKIGLPLISAITEVPIVPVTFQYVEKPELCEHESDLYTVCHVHFGKPIPYNRTASLIAQANNLTKIMENQRSEFWFKYGIHYPYTHEDIMRYLNHTYLKKFDAIGFTYDSESEAKFLYSPDKNQPAINEYKMNTRGFFVPGVTTKEEGKKYIMLPKEHK